MTTQNADNYIYQIIEFLTKGPQKTKSIDIVPSGWVSYDQKKGKLVAKFMPPPYDAENNELLYNLIDTCEKAPESWPSYWIKIRGHASKLI